ncbi:MAG: hypothetical protein DCC67_16405 [Planctomycetota bacterium]|nr:MAG: hypothetical protein DCC67_16405 [Planctomycetota bacterium]
MRLLICLASVARPPGGGAPRLGAAWALAAAVACGSIAGCKSLTSTGLGASRSEKKVIRQAAVDPFPTPADVGLAKQAEND